MQTSTTWKNSLHLLLGISINIASSPLSLANTQLNYNDVDANYLISHFNFNEFPMAVGTCNPFNLLGQGSYQIAQCIDSTTMEYTIYADETCTGVITDIMILDNSTQTGDGTYLDFNCDGIDAYAAIEFAVTSCDINAKAIVFGAVSSCALLTGLGTNPVEDYTSLNIYCETNYTELQYFDTPDADAADCTQDKWDQTVNATDECGFIMKPSADKIYGKLVECSTVEPTETPSAVPTGVPSRMPTSMPVSVDNSSDTNKNWSINHYTVLTSLMALLLLF